MGHRICASRKVAEKIESRAAQAGLYNEDVRQDQRYSEKALLPAETGQVPVLTRLRDPLISLEVKVAGEPSIPKEINCVDVLNSYQSYWLVQADGRKSLLDLQQA